MEISDISPKNIQVRNLNIPPIIDVLNSTSHSIPSTPPVVVNIGLPIINVPGCVEAHESNNNSNTIGVDDENGMVTYCDSGMPNFNPLDYKPDQMRFTGPPQQLPKVDPPKAPEVPPTPEVNTPPVATAVVECPTPAQEAKEPVGTFVEGYRKKVIEYKLFGNECVQITEAVGLPTQVVAGLPSGGQVMQVGGIAVVATTSALLAKPLADLLLKVVKPTVKKVIKKIAAIRGKSVPILSLKERQDLQRERTKAIRVLKSALKPKG